MSQLRPAPLVKSLSAPSHTETCFPQFELLLLQYDKRNRMLIEPSPRWVQLPQGLLARLQTSRTSLTHGFFIARGGEPYCDDCLVPLTARHLLVDCLNLRELREQYLAQCRGRNGSFSLSLARGEEVLSPGHEALKFLQDSGFLHLL